MAPVRKIGQFQILLVQDGTEHQKFLSSKNNMTKLKTCGVWVVLFLKFFKQLTQLLINQENACSSQVILVSRFL